MIASCEEEEDGKAWLELEGKISVMAVVVGDTQCSGSRTLQSRCRPPPPHGTGLSWAVPSWRCPWCKYSPLFLTSSLCVLWDHLEPGHLGSYYTSAHCCHCCPQNSCFSCSAISRMYFSHSPPGPGVTRPAGRGWRIVWSPSCLDCDVTWLWAGPRLTLQDHQLTCHNIPVSQSVPAPALVTARDKQ